MAPMSGDDWRGRLDGSDQGIRPLRRFWRSLPSPPRCKLCLRPFDGPGGAVMRMVGLGPWEKNPKYCRGCYQDIDANHGGDEVELSMLFADVRGSTGIAEGMAPLEYSHLLNRFYEVATSVLIDGEAVVDKSWGTRSSDCSSRGWPGSTMRPRRSVPRGRCCSRPVMAPSKAHGSRSAPASIQVSPSSDRWAIVASRTSRPWVTPSIPRHGWRRWPAPARTLSHPSGHRERRARRRP